MNQQAYRPNPAALRLMAKEAADPIIAKHWATLPPKNERIETMKTVLA